MTGIGELLVDDRSVMLASGLAAALVVIAAWRPERRLPSALLVLMPVAISMPLAQANLARYVDNPLPAYPVWIVVVTAMAAAGFAAVAIRVGREPVARSDLTVATAGIATGLFLAVPETGVLRLTPGPLVLVAVAVVADRLVPFRAGGTLLVAGSLAWLTAVDGVSRNATMLALATSLALAAALPWILGPADRAGPASGSLDRRTVWLVALTGLIVVACRLVGTSSSDRMALAFAGPAFAAAAGLALAIRVSRSGAGPAGP